MIPLASFALAGCLAVGAGSDRITVADLAPVFPNLQSIAPDTAIGLAPAPGVRRIFRSPELRQIAARLHAPLPEATEICFERPTAPLDSARLLDVMRRQLPGAEIELIEYSKVSVPDGEIEFPITGLRPESTNAGRGFWSGAIRYTGNRRILIWAKVKVLVLAPRVIAAADLKAARAVDPTDLRLEMRQVFPSGAVFVASIEEAAGRVLRRSVVAGTPLSANWLDARKDVTRGETVRVEVWNGGAHLELDAEAEGSGSAGESISVRNPSSQKRFQARVDGKGRVSVGKENQ
jgi:flagella basal body P-ring formation protein FlgA